jgi:hypothetical protein
VAARIGDGREPLLDLFRTGSRSIASCLRKDPFTMAQFPADARVAVADFKCRREGQSATIGDPLRGVFVAIPVDGLEILDALSAGRTVAESAYLYEQVHGEVPDVEGFLTALADHGFVTCGEESRPRDMPAAAGGIRVAPALARRLFGAPTVLACLLVAMCGAVLAAVNPGSIPPVTVLVFHRDLAALSLGLLAANVTAVILHEFAHLLAARAADAPARIGIGHRLWFLVAETDMTGIWLAPKRRRYLAFLAGPLIDAASAALLVAVLSVARGSLSAVALQFLGALLWTYLLRLLWQCFVFVRTDLYYVLATALDCKRLLGDTEDLLRNQLARLRRSPARIDQSALPRREQRAVRGFAVVWLVGRLGALATLVFVTLPVLEGYAAGIVRAVTGARSGYGTVDLLILAAVGLGMQGAGLFLWIRSLARGRTQRSTR